MSFLAVGHNVVLTPQLKSHTTSDFRVNKSD